MQLWNYTFGWLPLDLKVIILGFLAFAFIIALVKFIKR